MLDTKTILFSYVITNVLITVFIAFLWHRNRRRYAGLSYWLADYVLQAVGLLLVFLRDIAPDFLSIVTGNSLAILGIIFILMGLERFVGKAQGQVYHFVLLGGFVLSMSYFTYVQPDISIRTMLTTGAIFLLTGQSALLLIHRVDDALKPIVRAGGVVFSLYALLSLARVLSLLVQPLPAAAHFFQSPVSHTLFLLAYQTLSIALTFALMHMVTRRLHTEIDEHADHYRRTAEELRVRDEALRESEEKYRLIAENMADVITAMDMNLRFTYVSPSIKRLRGFTVEEAMEQTLDQVMTPKSLEIVSRIFEEEMQLEATGKGDLDRTRIMELEEYGKDGFTVWVENSLSFVRDKDGMAVGILAVTRDITKRKRAEEEKAAIEAQNRQLQKAESLGRMAGAIAHHFNNQLQTVQGNLELALEELPREGEAAETVAEAMKAAARAAQISGLMVTYLGQAPGKQEPLDLSEVCRVSLPMLRAAMPKDIVLETDLPSPGPVVRGDMNQIQQVLANLLSNAWESMAEGGGAIRLSVRTVAAADIPASHRFPVGWRPQDHLYALVAVADTGCGISEEDIEKLFDPFFTTKFTGRGLGLSVVLGIVRTHGGAVTVESRVGGRSSEDGGQRSDGGDREAGRGSVFRVFLPLTVEEVPRQPEKPTEALSG